MHRENRIWLETEATLSSILLLNFSRRFRAAPLPRPSPAAGQPSSLCLENPRAKRPIQRNVWQPLWHVRFREPSSPIWLILWQIRARLSHDRSELSRKIARRPCWLRGQSSMEVAQNHGIGQIALLFCESGEVLEGPPATPARIKDHVHDSFARLYRQRNLILHAGKTRAVALRSTLRGATPLVGAGLDRICHARFADGVTPIRLAGRARTALGPVHANDPAACVTLLGNL